MTERKVERNWNYQEKLDKAKKVVKKHWKPFTVGVVFTVATYVVVKRVDTRYLAGVTRTALLANKVTVRDQGVLLIQTFERWTGPPSWMVRCVETGRVFTSQEAAARIMDLSRGILTSHLNGQAENVGGYHFVRVGIAIPRSG
jgi:hypothetical protein